MKPGDLIKRKDGLYRADEMGMFVGMRTFASRFGLGQDYTCAEVIWFNSDAPNGERISTIQTNLIEVVHADR